MSKIEVDQVDPQSGTTLTLGTSGDTVSIPSGVTLSANLNANNLTSGTIPDARFPATLPAVDGSNLTNIQIAGGYTACDAITVTNTDTFALTAGGSPVSPESANNCIVSLNGVIQAPGNSYTISGSNIVFSTALTAGSDVIDFITVLGTALNVGTVSDGTITTAKLANGAVTSDKLASGVGGKVLQVVQSSLNSRFSTTSTSFVNSGLGASITPSSTSSKILILANLAGSYFAGNTTTMGANIYRNGSNLNPNSTVGRAFAHMNLDHTGFGGLLITMPIMYLDSPNSVSSISYDVYIASGSGNPAAICQDNEYSTITLMEIAG